MDIPLEIAFHNMERSEYVEGRIRERVERLQRRFGHINSCRVVVDVPHRSQVHPLAFHVRVEVRIPNKDLVVSRDPGPHGAHFDAYVVVRDAFDAMERQLDHHVEKLRGDVKAHAAPVQGRVLRTFADYGFIGTNDGREIYFHRHAVVGAKFEELAEGATVELSLADGESPQGPQATTVRPIRRMAFVPEPPKNG